MPRDTPGVREGPKREGTAVTDVLSECYKQLLGDGGRRMVCTKRTAAVIFRLLFAASWLIGPVVAPVQLWSAAETGQPLRVIVSIPPQTYFVERIGGIHVTISVLVKPGQSPATYELTAKQMAGLAEADVFFRIGVPFEERLVGKLESTLKDLNVVDTRQGIHLRSIDGAHHHGHGHALSGSDPHIWLNPALVAIQAETIARELIRLDSAHARDYLANLESFEADLDSLDQRIRELLRPFAGERFYIFHASYGYFADAYGLSEMPIEISGKEPSPKQLSEIVDQARADCVRTVFVQKEFSSTAAAALAEALGGAVVTVEPLAQDYPAALLRTARSIAEALRQRGQRDAEGGR